MCLILCGLHERHFAPGYLTTKATLPPRCLSETGPAERQEAKERQALEEIERERAKQRQGTRTDFHPNIVPTLAQGTAGKTREQVATLAGVSHDRCARQRYS